MGNHELGQKWIALVPNDIKVNVILRSMFKIKKAPKSCLFVKVKQSQNFGIIHGS